MEQEVVLTVNGECHELMIEPCMTLLEVLRDRLELTGTKYNCHIGNCGACTVLVDGTAVLACLTLAISTRGKEITTIEGLAQKGRLHPLQQAFIDHGAIQCGFCTPGMILSAKALLETNPAPSRAEVSAALEGNICRCTGYVKIIDAVLAAAETMRKGES